MTGARASLARTLGAALLLIAAVFAAFWPALSGEFQGIDDDRLFVLQRNWRGLSSEHLRWMGSTAALSHYYPLTWLTFGVDHELHGFTPPSGASEAPGYHLTSLALHALAAVALYFLARRVLALGAAGWSQRARDGAAFLGALVWAVHPLRAESVVWLTERSDVLSALFLFLALNAWLAWGVRSKGGASSTARVSIALVLSLISSSAFHFALDLTQRGVVAVGSPVALGVALIALLVSAFAAAGASRTVYLAALALFAASLLSKAWGIVVPAVLLALDAWPLRRWSWRGTFALVCEKAPFAVLALVFARIARFGQASAATDTVASWSDHTLLERVAQAGYGLAFYPLKTLAPTGLLPIYELPHEMRLFEPRWLVPLCVAVLASVVLFLARRRAPAAWSAWLVFAIVVSPVLGFSQSGPQLVADRYSYLSCVSLSLLLGAGGALVIARAPKLATPIALVALSALGFATWRQARVWSTSERLWERAVEIAPEVGSNWMSLGALRSTQASLERDPARQRKLLYEALALHKQGEKLSADPLILRNLAQVHTALVRAEPARAQEHRLAAVEYARRALERARELGKASPEYLFDYGTDLINLGRLEEGVPLLRQFVAERPDRLLGRINLGVGLVMQGNVEEGLASLRYACQLEPYDVRPWETLAEMCEQVNLRDEALAAWRRVLAIDARHAQALDRAAALVGR